MISPSPTLLQLFYQAIHEWIVAGLPEDPVSNPYGFSPDRGLCINLLSFGCSQDTNRDDLKEAFNDMEDEFEEAGLDTVFPFGDLTIYEHECDTKTIYQNQQRLDWIKDHQ